MTSIPIHDGNLRNLQRDLDELATYVGAVRDILLNASCPDETEGAAILVGLLAHRIEAVRARYEVPQPIILSNKESVAMARKSYGDY